MFTSPHEKTKGTIDGQYLLQTFFEPLKEFFLSGLDVYKRQELQNDMSILRYTDYKSMIQEVKPDLVSIATDVYKRQV